MQFINSPRGDTEVRVSFDDLYRIVREKLNYFHPDRSDPDAFCQDMCVRIEKKMGIYPNVGAALATTAGEATNTAQERLDDYRAAVAFIAADAWDGCLDCMEILQAARGLDIECDWAGDPNVIAEKLTSLRRRAALATDKG